MENINLDINEECKKDKAFSDDLKDGDSCSNCEFCISRPSGNFIGSSNGNVGDLRFCEKGYWKE